MKLNSASKIVSAAIIIICGFGVIFLLSNFNEKVRPVLSTSYEDEDLALQGARLKGYSLGFEGLIADWYWMKSLQYVGDKIIKSNETISLDNLKSLNPRLLYPYLDNATTLDPQFIDAYSYGAIVLPAIDSEQAIKIARKGIDNNPENWRLYHQLGYIYWTLKDYPKATETYAQGAKISGAPPFMQMMAAKMKSEGGSRDIARDIYTQMYEQAQDENVKETARLRLLQLDSLAEQDAVQKILQNFQTQNNRCPNNLREILPLLQKVKLSDGKSFRLDSANNLADPSGVPYNLDKENCAIKLNVASKIPQN